ncbi:hypothetical protein C8J57DRAFT_1222299 [Mycena rebaudengoi]|nr:hypothetical protein C8J57DRAFT_1222299 [Mycena rebaudengoi]
MPRCFNGNGPPRESDPGEKKATQRTPLSTSHNILINKEEHGSRGVSEEDWATGNGMGNGIQESRFSFFSDPGLRTNIPKVIFAHIKKKWVSPSPEPLVEMVQYGVEGYGYGTTPSGPAGDPLETARVVGWKPQDRRSRGIATQRIVYARSRTKLDDD